MGIHITHYFLINYSHHVSCVATPESFEHAKELLAEGKRDLLVHAIPDAVSNCSKACEIMAKHKGEMAAECAEAYFYYGKALLELSRVESGVLGNALDGVDMETKPTDVKDALVEDTEAMTTDEKSEIEGEKAGDEMETDAEKADAEAGNLEQAWQMFDLAKVIYGKAGDIAKECESLTFLGEVSLENSNFKQAVEDLTLCLTKRIKALPADSRSIAETHYQLGVAQAHCAEYANAEKSLAAAVTVLNTRIASLKKMETSDNITKELAELTLLCTEIKERTADHKDMQKGTYKEDKDFVSIFKGTEVHEIGTKKAVATA